MNSVNDKLIILFLISLLSASIYLSFYDIKQNKSTQFELWKLKFNVKYDSQFQNAYREKIFLQNKLIVEIHNKNVSRSYNRGINRFSALTKQQFKAIYLSYNREISIKTDISKKQNNEVETPTVNVDWRTQGAVGPVKDQGHCGSCWAFSTVAGAQGLSKLFKKQLQSFSEQQLIDCNTANNGCHGGQMRRALDFIKKYGALLQSQYPYKGVQGNCTKLNGNFYVSGYKDVQGCNQLANALTSRPIIAGVDSSNWSDYESGIFDNCPYDPDQFNHGILIVGMTDNAWIIKNSWTAEWGEQGYMRLKKDDTCNVCDDGIFPLY